MPKLKSDIVMSATSPFQSNALSSVNTPVFTRELNETLANLNGGKRRVMKKGSKKNSKKEAKKSSKKRSRKSSRTVKKMKKQKGGEVSDSSNTTTTISTESPSPKKEEMSRPKKGSRKGSRKGSKKMSRELPLGARIGIDLGKVIRSKISFKAGIEVTKVAWEYLRATGKEKSDPMAALKEATKAVEEDAKSGKLESKLKAAKK